MFSWSSIKNKSIIPLTSIKPVYRDCSYQSAGIDFSSYEEVTALENDDFMLISRGGSLKKIKVSNARDYLNPPSDAVMVGDDFVVANGQYVVVP